MSKTSCKGKYIGTPICKRGVGGQLWQHYGKLFGTHRAAAGRAQLVVERPPEGADPFWTHSLLTIWENMLVQKHHIRFSVILHKPRQKISHLLPVLACTCP